jgi:hypothetical protein
MLKIRFQFEDFVSVSIHFHSNTVSYLKMLPLKKFQNTPPPNIPLITVKNLKTDFRYDCFFLIETKAKKLKTRLAASTTSF